MAIQVPGYEIQQRLGEGGMADVYLARQTSLDRLVALKVLKKFDTDTQAQRFFNEGKIIASLEHRNIITIHDLGEVNGRCFLAMEYLEGGDLKQRIDTGLATGEALRLLKLIAQCLAFVHQKGIIHRDIKPENILFRGDDLPVLTDFGVARQLQADSSLTMDGSAIGSPHYLSPEQAEQKTLDPRTDIYSLGIVFYEMLTGRQPFSGESPIEIIIAHLTTEAAPLPQDLAHYQALLDLMIAKKADQRFESAAELIDYIERLPNPGSRHRLTGKFGRTAGAAESLAEASTNSGSTAIRRRYLGVGFALAASLAVAATAYIYPPLQSSLPATASVKTADDNHILSAETRNEIERYLADAQTLLDASQPPLGVLEQANGAYHRVLEADPGNPQALAGIERVSLLMDRIRRDLDWNLAKADGALRSRRLTSPARDNAMFYFRKVLDLDPNNPAALQGTAKVADAYGDLAEANLQEFKYSQAKIYIEKGLSLTPSSPRLLALKDQTNAFTDAPKRVFGKITSLFD